MSQVQRYTGPVTPSEGGGFVALMDYQILEQQLAQTKALLEEVETGARGPRPTNWWAVAVDQYRRKRAAEIALEELRASQIGKVFAMSDEQIAALIVAEGRNPDDVAELSKQAMQLATLRVSQKELLAVCEEFVRKVETGRARSTDSYQKMKAAVALAKKLDQGAGDAAPV